MLKGWPKEPPEWLQPHPKVQRWTPSIFVAIVTAVGWFHLAPHQLTRVFEGRLMRREDAKRLLDPVQQGLHTNIDLKVLETHDSEWQIDAFGNPEKGLILMSRIPYFRSSTTALAEMYPTIPFGPLGTKTIDELTAVERKHLLKEHRLAFLSQDEVRWRLASEISHLDTNATLLRTMTLLLWIIAGFAAHSLKETSRVLRHFKANSTWDFFFIGGWLNYTWLYRQHVYRADEEGLKVVSNPRAAVNALEMQRQWNLNQRNAEGWKGKIVYSEKGDYRFEYPLFISTRINHLRDTIESKKSDKVVV